MIYAFYLCRIGIMPEQHSHRFRPCRTELLYPSFLTNGSRRPSFLDHMIRIIFETHYMPLW